MERGAVVALEYACVGRAVENFPLVSPPTAATKAAEAEAEAPAPRASPRRPTEADIAYFDAAAAAAADGRAPWLLAATDAAALPQWRPLLQALRTPDFPAGGGTVCLAPARDCPFTTREAAAALQIAPVGADAATLAAARGLGLSARMGVLYMTQRYEERYEDPDKFEEVEVDTVLPAAPGFRGRHYPECRGESSDASEFLTGSNFCGLKLAAADAERYATQAPDAFIARADPAAVGMSVGEDWPYGWPLVIDAAPALMIDFPPAGEEREALLAAASRAADASCAAFTPTSGYAEAAEEIGRRCGEAIAKREALPRLKEEWEAAEKAAVAVMDAQREARRAVEAAEKAAGAVEAAPVLGAKEAAEKAAGAGEAAPQAVAVRAEAAAAPPAGAEEEEEEEAAPAAGAKETAAAPEAASAKEAAASRRPDAQKPAAAKKARTAK